MIKLELYRKANLYCQNLGVLYVKCREASMQYYISTTLVNAELT